MEAGRQQSTADSSGASTEQGEPLLAASTYGVPSRYNTPCRGTAKCGPQRHNSQPQPYLQLAFEGVDVLPHPHTARLQHGQKTLVRGAARPSMPRTAALPPHAAARVVRQTHTRERGHQRNSPLHRLHVRCPAAPPHSAAACPGSWAPLHRSLLPPPLGCSLPRRPPRWRAARKRRRGRRRVRRLPACCKIRKECIQAGLPVASSWRRRRCRTGGGRPGGGTAVGGTGGRSAPSSAAFCTPARTVLGGGQAECAWLAKREVRLVGPGVSGLLL